MEKQNNETNPIEEDEIKIENPKKRLIDINMSWIVYLLLIVCAFFIGQALISQFNKMNINMNQYLYIILVFALGLLINFFAYGLGRIIFGYIAGLKVSYVEWLGIEINFSDGKLHFSFRPSLILESKIVLIPRKEKVIPQIYLVGGLINYLIISALLLIIGKVVSDNLFYSAIFSQLFGLILVACEIIPVKMDFINDFFTLVLIGKKENKEAYLLNLNNVKHELNHEPFEVVDYKKYDSIFKIDNLLYKYYNLFYQEKMLEAEKVLDKIINFKNYAREETYIKACGEKLYILLKNGKQAKADKIFMKLSHSDLKFIKGEKKFVCFRQALIISALLEDKEIELNEVIEDYNKFIDDGNEFELEQQYIQNDLAFIKSLKPTWKINSINKKSN